MSHTEALCSCDTFVCMPDSTKSGAVIFGKNSDRPNGEVQEVVFEPGRQHDPGSELQCTYIKIPQAERTFSVLLSKPSWMWGAEMGANENGVAVGNEAVWNRMSSDEVDLVPRLLGMDLLRIGLERSSTADECLGVICSHLESFGQGGQCSDIVKDFAYHNSFLIADHKEAWILETAQKWWVAKRIVDGTRNISNCMSIGADFDKIHPGLEKEAEIRGWWDKSKDGPFNWARDVGGEGTIDKIKAANTRFDCGDKLLKEHAKNRDFGPQNMMTILRDQESNICRPYAGSAFPTTGSQVSLLRSGGGSMHWFTATPDPHKSVFKLAPGFGLLSKEGKLSEATKSKKSYPEKVVPSERGHELWDSFVLRRSDSSISKGALEKLCELEGAALKSDGPNNSENTFDKAVREEINLYKE